MDRRNQLGTALVGLAVVLFVLPTLFPVQPVLAHQTWGSTIGTPDELESEGYEIVAYENLSERGQELYVATLENGGEYTVPQGEGAPEFDYPTNAETRAAHESGNDSALRGVVIERPEDDGDLPPPDEPRFDPPEEAQDEMTEEEQQRQEVAQRYEAVRTSTEQPGLGATPQLIRLLATLLAVVSLGVGGYLLSSK